MKDLRITTEKAELDIPLVHRILSEQTSWAKGISLAVVQRSIEHSLCFGGFLGGAQVAFARHLRLRNVCQRRGRIRALRASRQGLRQGAYVGCTRAFSASKATPHDAGHRGRAWVVRSVRLCGSAVPAFTHGALRPGHLCSRPLTIHSSRARFIASLKDAPRAVSSRAGSHVAGCRNSSIGPHSSDTLFFRK